jgi:hypothetical protein
MISISQIISQWKRNKWQIFHYRMKSISKLYQKYTFYKKNLRSIFETSIFEQKIENFEVWIVLCEIIT